MPDVKEVKHERSLVDNLGLGSMDYDRVIDQGAQDQS
ncbi:uncharacterized protein METZ01_LOCUS399393 [marine metagenome]|uniref:Uncharacterized protein n=1 Tax=marine metagenome TaxID=408172 RepID=A0A382VJ40_9ZZZZ